MWKRRNIKLMHESLTLLRGIWLFHGNVSQTETCLEVGGKKCFLQWEIASCPQKLVGSCFLNDFFSRQVRKPEKPFERASALFQKATLLGKAIVLLT